MSSETTPTTASKWPYLRAFIQSGLEDGGLLEHLGYETKEWLVEAIADVARLEARLSLSESRISADVDVIEGLETELKIANHQIECFVEDRDKLERELGRREKVLEAIIIRCEEGDKRTDWLPTIARIACAALAPKEPGAILSQDDMDRELHGGDAS